MSGDGEFGQQRGEFRPASFTGADLLESVRTTGSSASLREPRRSEPPSSAGGCAGLSARSHRPSAHVGAENQAPPLGHSISAASGRRSANRYPGESRGAFGHVPRAQQQSARPTSSRAPNSAAGAALLDATNNLSNNGRPAAAGAALLDITNNVSSQGRAAGKRRTQLAPVQVPASLAAMVPPAPVAAPPVAPARGDDVAALAWRVEGLSLGEAPALVAPPAPATAALAQAAQAAAASAAAAAAQAPPSAARMTLSLAAATGMEDGDPEDPQSVAEYVQDITAGLFRQEALVSTLVDSNYMRDDWQTDINHRMRAILVDWLVEVHMKYRLRKETLYLTVNLIDRYLSRAPVMRRKLQLLGVVSMFIAAKFEEIHPPKVQEFAYITDNTYTVQEILTFEFRVLDKLGWQINVPTEAHFLDHLQKMNSCDETHKKVSSYVLELGLLEMRMLRYTPSHRVSAALLVSNELLSRRPAWPASMVHHSRQSEQQLRECAEEMWQLLNAASSSSLQAVRKKYQLDQNRAVARLVESMG